MCALCSGVSTAGQHAIAALWDAPLAPLAQLDRALPSEGRGQRFESSRVRHIIPLNYCNCYEKYECVSLCPNICPNIAFDRRNLANPKKTQNHTKTQKQTSIVDLSLCPLFLSMRTLASVLFEAIIRRSIKKEYHPPQLVLDKSRNGNHISIIDKDLFYAVFNKCFQKIRQAPYS